MRSRNPRRKRYPETSRKGSRRSSALPPMMRQVPSVQMVARIIHRAAKKQRGAKVAFKTMCICNHVCRNPHENDMCSLVRFHSPIFRHQQPFLHRTVSRRSFVDDMLQMTRVPSKVSFHANISTRVDPNHVFHFRAAVFFTMFPPRVKRMPSTIAYLHFFVVNRDNELVTPNKTWAIEKQCRSTGNY